MNDLVQRLRRVARECGQDYCDEAANRIEADDALLRQALEALEAYSRSNYVRHQHPKKHAAGVEVVGAIRARLGDTT